MIGLHFGGSSTFDPPLVAAVVVTVAGSSVLLGLGLAALLRRRSWSYLLVAGALAALFARATVAAMSMLYLLAPLEHHLIEHGLDAVMVAMVVGAVYHARTVERRAGDVDPEGIDDHAPEADDPAPEPHPRADGGDRS